MSPAGAAPAWAERVRSARWEVVVGALCLIAIALVAVVQVVHLGRLLDPAELLTAGHAKGLVVGYALAALATAAGAAALPARWIWLPVAGAALVAAAALLATLVLGGQAWSFLFAALTMAACWQLGRWLLLAARVPRLAELAPVAWLAGFGALGLVLLFVGRAGLLGWWTAAGPVLALGAIGLVGLARSLGTTGARAAWSAVSSSRLASGSAALCLLLAGLASVWAAAPELMFDALSYKAWLPSEWARTGEIATQTTHPYFNVAGFAQIVAIPGHVAGAEAVGRYLQWLAQGALLATIWWVGRRSPWAPVGTAVVAVTPQLLWQATTAYEDTILVLAAIAVAVAVLAALREPGGSVVAVGAVLGGLAGVCVGLKLHLAPLALALVLGWLVMRGRHGWKRASGAALLGLLVVAAPPLILRWIDLGNPVLPFLNNLFKSPHWPADSNLSIPVIPILLVAGALAGFALITSRTGRRPGRSVVVGGAVGLVAAAVLVSTATGASLLGGPGSRDPIGLLWQSITDPGRSVSWAPVGVLGLLSAATAVATLTGWRKEPGGRGVPALWLGVLGGAAVWYTQARDPRYLLPAGALAVLVILLILTRGRRPLPRRDQVIALAGLAAAATLLWPSTLAQFWNLPGKGIPWRAALGELDQLEYERQATTDRDMVAALDRLSPPGAIALADNHQRAWLTEGRDLLAFYELQNRLSADGPVSREPAELLSAVRATGVSWVLVRTPFSFASTELPRFPGLERMVETYGDRVWSSPQGILYRLPDSPGDLERLPDRG